MNKAATKVVKEDKYLQEIVNIANKFFEGKNVKFFIFGSSLNKAHFGDVDLGVIGDVSDKELSTLKETFENSAIPYFVDVINFKEVSEEFRDNVLNNRAIWIKR